MANNQRQSLRALQERLAVRLADAKKSGAEAAWLAVEAGGNICVASLVFGGISVFSSQGGLTEWYEADEPYCTNIAFGGPNMQTAFITLSGYGRLVAADWPRPGLALNDPLTARG